jgi:hypothetical protein
MVDSRLNHHTEPYRLKRASATRDVYTTARCGAYMVPAMISLVASDTLSTGIIAVV